MKVKSLFISDLHLGCKKNRAKDALKVLGRIEYDNLFLLGDIVDIKALSHEWNWSLDEQDVYSTITEKAKTCHVVWTIGNHERTFFDHLNNFERILICSGYPYSSGKRNFYLTHGHQFDHNLESSHWPRSLINAAYNGTSEFNLKICSQLKKLIRRTPGYLNAFKTSAINFALEHGYTDIMCGHTHQQELFMDKVNYYNVGDFREDATWITENFDGEFNLHGL
jgi:UDP-2,3-diacylglucosamine pyrophosphatase LpxH